MHILSILCRWIEIFPLKLIVFVIISQFLYICKTLNYHLEYAAKFPELCQQTDDDEQDGLTFEIKKRRLSFRLTAPYSTDRRKAASEYAKKNGMKGSAEHQEKH